ncbi:MutS domain V protein [Dictyocaulus viviparus]|uniref:MutS domain V protein n=1 Tax=Dictyocaulus viviparus TaxID=29172 RepID=A0A0D8Y8Z1_DICVI|nr:MutS domain V protein [Dictyocaulus viviparus]
MDEVASILQYSNQHTLVVIDELARSTSTEEGIGISFAVIEKLVKQKAFTVLATHLLDLAVLEVSCCVIVNYHFPPHIICKNGHEQFSPTHRLLKGPYNGPIYGFELVELSSFPEEVLECARTQAQRLREESSNKGVMNAETLLHHTLIRTALNLLEVCKFKDQANRGSLIEYLKDIRRNFQINSAKAQAIAGKEMM